MDNYKYGDHKLLINQPEHRELEAYKKVLAVVSAIIRSGAVQLGQGSCIAMGNILNTALKHAGIESRLVECTATLTYDYDGVNPQIAAVGFERVANPGELDTHVVVITNTEPPLLIDASISHRLPQNIPVVLDVVNGSGQDATIMSVTYPSAKLKISYAEKPVQTIPLLYQNNFLDRMNTDRKIFTEMRTLRMLNYIGIGVSLFALINVLLKVFRIL